MNGTIFINILYLKIIQGNKISIKELEEYIKEKNNYLSLKNIKESKERIYNILKNY